MYVHVKLLLAVLLYFISCSFSCSCDLHVLYPLQHIFCETCIQLWFDRERTCPLCRSVIASDPKWRDGSTEGFVMLF